MIIKNDLYDSFMLKSCNFASKLELESPYELALIARLINENKYASGVHGILPKQDMENPNISTKPRQKKNTLALIS